MELDQAARFKVLDAIAAALGGEVVKRSEVEGGNWCMAWVHVSVQANENFPACCVSLNYHADRQKGDYVHVSGAWPEGPERSMVTGRDAEYGTPNPSINVSAAKRPEVAAADIRRRFMPEFSRLYAKAAEVIAARVAHAEAVERNHAAIAKACGGSYSKSSFSNNWRLEGLPEGIHVARVGNDNIRLELECTVEEACAIVREWAARVPA